MARETPFTAASADRTGSTQPCQVMPEMSSVTVESCGAAGADDAGRVETEAQAAIEIARTRGRTRVSGMAVVLSGGAG
jgi:hypothetical protein